MVIEHQRGRSRERDTSMASIPSRIHDRVSSGRLLPIGRRSLPKPRDRFDQLGTGRATRSDVYARPDIYDMEYEGAGNHDARLLARVRRRRVLELACGSGRVTVTLAAALPMADIVGVDSSIDMLGKAATARDAAEPLVRERVTREGRHARLARHGRHLRRRRHCLLLGVALAYAR
jgi:SAM-dependent methyltransferase